MAVTEKYELEEILTNQQNWNAILQTNFEKVDDHLHTRGVGECGEDCDEFEAVYWKSDGKLWLAQADGSKQPCIGLMVEDGLTAESKRFQIRGEITNVAWTWTVGGSIYLDPTTPGTLTQTPSGSNAQILGYAQSATTMFITPIYMSSLVGDQPYEIGGTYNGVISTGTFVLQRFPLPRGVTYAVDLPNSYMYCDPTSGATADAEFSYKKNGTEFGTATFTAGLTANAAAAVDKTGGKVGIPVTAHGLATDRKIVIAGSTNYNGTYDVDADSTINEIVIVETYVAETFAGTETITMPWAVLVCASETTFVEQDVFEIVTPGTPDATLANLGWVTVGIRAGV